MAPKLILEIVGDTTALEKSFAKTTRAAKAFSGTVKEQASKAIVANVEQRQALEKLAAEYRRVATNAKRGSEAQIVSARLAEDAERKLAASYGVVGRESRLAAGHASRFGGEVGKASRGALAGSGVFRSLGRSIAFASGGFLAFATAGEFLRKSIDAAKEAQVTQAQLAAQFKASGLSLADYQKRIEETTSKLTLLSGFEDDQLKAAFTTIFRSTQNVTKSLRDVGLAADLARAKHISLSQAALVVAKTEAGNTTLLRRQGIQIGKNATVEQALAAAHRATAGQARAGTTAQERFGAVLHHTEEIIGTALLPSLNRYLNSGAKWLTQMNESGKLQRDVETATKTLTEAVSGVKAVVDPAAHAFKLFGEAVGGTKREVELLSGAFLLLKTRTALIRWGLLAAEVGGVGTAAETSAAKAGLLRTRLLSLKTLGPIAVTIAINEVLKRATGFDPIGRAASLGDATASDQTVKVGGRTFIKGSIAELEARQRQALQRRFGISAGRNLFAPGASPAAAASDRTTFTLTPAQRRAIDLAGKPSLEALRAQADFDKAQLAALQQRFDAGKVGGKSFTAATIRLKDDLVSQESAITSILQEQAQKVAERARKAVAERKAAATKTRKALEQVAENASIFLGGISRGVELGVDKTRLAAQAAAAARAAAKQAEAAKAFNVPEGLQVSAARTAALGLDDQSKRIAEKIRASALKAIKSGRLGFQGLLDAWNTIGSINDQLKQGSDRVTGKFKHVDPNKLLAGLDIGLTAAQRRALVPAVAQLGLGGRVPATRSIPFGGGVTVHGGVHLHGIQDVKALEEELTKRKGSRSGSRRGPYAGRH